MAQISLKAARVNAGFKLYEVAKMIDKTPKTLSHWERGVTPITSVYFHILCKIYEIDSDYVKVPVVNDGEYNS